MAAISVTTTPQKIPEPWTDLQNLGAGDIYLGNANTVSSSNGVKVASGQTYSRSLSVLRGIGPRDVWVVTNSGTQDCRTLA